MWQTRPMRWVAVLFLASCDCGSGVATPQDSAIDTAPQDTSSRFDSGPVMECRAALPVDMLWVIDNSNSMAEEQNNLAANFRTLIDVLTNPPDRDGDGMLDYPPVTDFRLGVITTDAGIGNVMNVDGCDALGDNGALITSSRSLDPVCAGATTGGMAWLQYNGGDATSLSETFSCLARLGTEGCGLEQQLEAAHRALTTQAAGPNAGFVREGSLLAVVFVTDEDDCSASDPSIFEPGALATLGPYGTRCAEHPELLHPVSRYSEMLRGLRFGDQRLNPVVVAAITGAPNDLVGDPSRINYDALLTDPRMNYSRDPLDETRLTPACDVTGVGSAVPGRRIVQLVQDFAATGDGVVQSICEDDFSPAVRAIAELIAARVCPAPI